MTNQENKKLANFTYTLLSIVLVGFILVYAKEVFVPFVLALILAYIIIPLSDKLCQHLGLNSILAVAISYIVIIGGIVVVSALSSTPLIDLLNNSDAYLEKALEVTRPMLQRLEEFGLSTTLLFSSETSLKALGFGGGAIVGFGVQFLVVVLFSFFIVAGHEKQKLTHPILDQIDDELQKFITTKLLISLALGVMVSLALWLLGVKWAIAFGLLAFMLNFIPTIGPILASLLPIPIALVELSPMMALATLAVMVAIMGVAGFVIEVKMMGDVLKLHPLVVLMSLIFWGVLWGVAGMFLAIPMTVMMKIAFAHNPQTAVFANILAGKLPR